MRTGETTITARRGLSRRPNGGAGPKRLGRPWVLRRGGFTLTEIMIAMGVLAVGMGMIAGAMQAGIQVHTRTIDDIMRQLIGDNALAVVQARVRHTSNTDNGIPTGTYKLLDTMGTGTSYFGPGDLKYPWNKTNTPYGAAVLMKRRAIDATSSANDYDVMIMPYTIIPATPGGSLGDVQMTTVTCTIKAGTTTSSSGTTLTASAAGVLQAGSVVIDSRTDPPQTYFVTAAPTTTTAELSETVTVGTNIQLTTLTLTVAGRLELSKPVRTKTALSPKPGWKPGQ